MKSLPIKVSIGTIAAALGIFAFISGIKTIDELIDVFKNHTSRFSLTPYFRNEAQALSEIQVKEMIKKHNFFEYYWNKSGCGFDNEFENQTINGDKIIIDKKSNLMWQQGGSPYYMTWEDARQWIKDLNKNKFGGYNDWRLPTLEEGLSLVEAEKNYFRLHINQLFNYKQKTVWTIDSVLGKKQKWMIDFYGGNCNKFSLNQKCYVRAVR